MKLWLDTAWTAFLDFGVYLLGVVGIIASRYLDAFARGEPIDVSNISVMTVVFASLLALAFIYRDEQSTTDREGSRKYFVRRAQNAIARGFMWQSIATGGAAVVGVM